MKTKLCKFPSINQYRNIVDIIKHERQYIGKDKDGTPMYDSTLELPTITFKGTVKLHGCFEKNTLVTLSNGENIPISEITVGTSILSYDIENDIEIIKKVKNVFITESDKNWVELVFNDRKIKCTEDHKFYTKNRGWVSAIDLTENDEFIIV